MDASAEVFDLTERVVVSPSSGRVALPPAAALSVEGEFVLRGDPVAAIRIGDVEVPVTTRFQGWMMGFLVLDGQPIHHGDPIAWLRRA